MHAHTHLHFVAPATCRPVQANTTTQYAPSKVDVQGSRARQRAQPRCAAQERERSTASGRNAPVNCAAVERRQLLVAVGAVLGCAAAAGSGPLAGAAAAAAGGRVEPQVAALQQAALQAYAQRDFRTAVQLISQLIELEPKEGKWREMRAQALVDGKNFPGALGDFDEALRLTPAALLPLDRARLLAGRGLAYEGIGDWVEALSDYEQALSLAAAAGQQPDPYVLNSRGNCHASLGEWKEARADYLASAQGFQRASGFRGRGGSMTPRLDGAVFASSNAALMLAQIGDESAALKEMQTVARRAPGSADMRIALAALYWRRGQEAAAESEWDFACTNITVGCSKYQDEEWLFTVRRWPPAMCAFLKDFLKLRSSQEGQAASAAAAQQRLGAAAGKAGFKE